MAKSNKAGKSKGGKGKGHKKGGKKGSVDGTCARLLKFVLFELNTMISCLVQLSEVELLSEKCC